MEPVHRYSKIYQDRFDPISYLTMLTGALSGNDPSGTVGGQVTLVNELMKTGEIRGKDLLEVGCGPSILFSIVPSQYFENVYLSEYLDGNLKIIQTWLDDKPEQYNYQPFFDFAGKHLDTGICSQEALRKKICGVFQCDVHQPEVLPPGVIPRKFDCVTNSLVLHSACVNDDELKKAVSHLASLLNPGGTLITYAGFESTFFINTVDRQKFLDLPLTEESLSLALKEAGLQVISKRCEVYTFDKSVCDAKYHGVYVARKC